MEKRSGHLAQNHQSAKGIPVGVELLQLIDIEVVLDPEEHQGDAVLCEKVVQTVLHMAEKGTLTV